MKLKKNSVIWCDPWSWWRKEGRDGRVIIFLGGLGWKLGPFGFAACFPVVPRGRAPTSQGCPQPERDGPGWAGNEAVPIPGWRRLRPSGVIPNSSFGLFLNASSQEVFGASLGAPNHRPRDSQAAARSPRPPPSLCPELCFPIPESLVGSKPQLRSQARPPCAAFLSWIFDWTGFIKTQKAGSWDCAAFLQQLVDVTGFGGEKGSCVPLAAAFLKVAHGCGGVKLLGLTHSGFGLFHNFCQIF